MATADQPSPVVLITGAARRLGRTIARTLHQSGFTIIVHYHRSCEDAEALCHELNRQRAGSAGCVAGDLLDVGHLESLIHQAVAPWQRLDMLVNNASTFFPTPLGSVTAEQFDNLIGTNLRAPLFLSQSAAPYLRATNGNIVNIVDIHAERPLKEYPVYSVAKAGLVMLTRSLARELAPDIRVNAVAPGAILWPEETPPDAATQNHILARTALKRRGTPQDIAEAVRFLATAAPYITGQIISVDGGRSLYQ